MVRFLQHINWAIAEYGEDGAIAYFAGILGVTEERLREEMQPSDPPMHLHDLGVVVKLSDCETDEEFRRRAVEALNGKG